MTHKQKDLTKTILAVIVLAVSFVGYGFYIDDRIEAQVSRIENRRQLDEDRLREMEKTLARIEEHLRHLDERLYKCE